MLIYKILRKAEWVDLQSNGSTSGAPVDLVDGFIHFSTAAQLPETLARHFAGEPGLILLACEGDNMGEELRWEPSRKDDLFPHLYRQLELTDVLWRKPLAIEGATHVIPEDVS